MLDDSRPNLGIAQFSVGDGVQSQLGHGSSVAFTKLDGRLKIVRVEALIQFAKKLLLMFLIAKARLGDASPGKDDAVSAPNGD